MNRVFCGYDPRQAVSYTVLQHSILARSSEPVAITPLVLGTLPLKRTGLTPFTWSRFLVPWLCGFEGWALFTDVDVLVQGNIAELFALADPGCAVQVSKNRIKFEWASVMLFNCAHPDNRELTPDYIEKASGLHQIGWTPAVGNLPPEWNHLVGYDPEPPTVAPKLLHYTQGVPAYPETVDGGYADEWRAEAEMAMSTLPWVKLMGNSVHAKPVIERLIAQGKIPADTLEKLKVA